MIETLIGWVVAAAVAGLALFGVRWKNRADRLKQQIEGYQYDSDRWQRDAAKRIEEIKRQAAGKAPINTNSRKEFE